MSSVTRLADPSQTAHRIDSEEGAGTAVHLFLPRCADNDDAST